MKNNCHMIIAFDWASEGNSYSAIDGTLSAPELPVPVPPSTKNNILDSAPHGIISGAR